MSTVIIVDDEMPARLHIKSLLSAHPDFKLIGEASNGDDAILLCQEKLPDVVFLDIQLQDMDGFEIASELIKLPKLPKIVFATAYNEYAIEAFEYSALDYLQKPIKDNRFARTIERLREELKAPEEEALKKVQLMLQKHLEINHKKQKITLEKDGKLFVLDYKDIIIIETEDRNTKVISSRGDFISNCPMGDWEEKLQTHGFFRPHRSFLINLDEIDQIVLWFNNSLQIKMRGYKDKNIPISRNRLREFKELVGFEG